MKYVLVFTLLALASLAPAHAATFCVGDATALEAAIDTAETNGEDDLIKIQLGTYVPTGSRFIYQSAESFSLTLQGGWFSFFGGPCSGHVNGATWSKLDGSGTKSPLTVAFYGTGGNLFVQGLSLLNGAAVGDPAIFVSGVPGWGGDIRFERVIVRGNAGNLAVPNAVFISAHSGNVSIFDSVFATNYVVDSGDVIRIDDSSTEATGTRFMNNTVVGNTSLTATAIAAIAFSGNGYRRIANNVIRGNSTYDLMLIGNNAQLTGLWNNDLGSVYGEAATSVGNILTDPRFVAADDYRPAADSPLVDGGTNAFGVNSYDVVGRTRVVFGLVDIGAYEQQDNIFANGFQ